MTIRLILIIPTLDQGGAEKQLALLATGLSRDEFQVSVATLTRNGPWAELLAEHQVPVTCFRKRWKVDPACYWQLKRWLRREQPDVVHTWLFAANAYGRQAALAAGVPHVLGGERCVDRWKVWHELAIDRRLARRTDGIVTNSQGVVEFYHQHGIPRDKFAVIPNGIAERARERGMDRATLLDQLQLPAEARLIGAVGRLWPQKRYKDLIWAAELLRAIRGDVHFLIVGEGPQRSRLVEMRDALDLQGRVHFLGHRADVADLLPHLDCFWLGSGYEGQSNSLMEAMLAGVPVVATDIPGNRELILPGQTGVLLPVGDRAGFARHTNLILDDATLARELGHAARERMQTEFTVTRMVQRHAELYRRVAAGDGVSSPA